MNIECNYEGRCYLFNGKSWTNQNGEIVPAKFAHVLDTLGKDDIEFYDQSIMDSDELRKSAIGARERGQLKRADRLSHKAIELNPISLSNISVRSSILRSLGRAKEAIEVCDKAWRDNGPILTSKAAALCDLNRWEEAKRIIGRVLAEWPSKEAFQVSSRIKSARPELYN